MRLTNFLRGDAKKEISEKRSDLFGLWSASRVDVVTRWGSIPLSSLNLPPTPRDSIVRRPHYIFHCLERVDDVPHIIWTVFPAGQSNEHGREGGIVEGAWKIGGR